MPPGMVALDLKKLDSLQAVVKAESLCHRTVLLGLEGHVASVAIKVATNHIANGKIPGLMACSAFILHHAVIDTMHDEGVHGGINTVDLYGVVESSGNSGNSCKCSCAWQPSTEVKPPPLDIPIAYTREWSTR